MKFFRILLCAVVLTGIVQAQHPDAGTVAFPFLNLNYDARGVGMGNASFGVPNEIYGVLSNPASIAFVEQVQVMGGYRQIIMDVWGGPLAYLHPTQYGVVAANLTALTSGAFEAVDEDGMNTGHIARSSYVSGGVTWARLFNKNISAGVTVKGVYNHLGTDELNYSADGFAIDAGMQYRSLTKRWVIGAVFSDFGFMRSGYTGTDSQKYSFPYGFGAGISYVPRHVPTLRVALDLEKRKGDYLNFRPGFEFSLMKNVFLRGGYCFSSEDLGKAVEVFRGNRDEDYQKSNMKTLSLGVGMATTMDRMDLNLDVALQLYSDVALPAVLISLIAGF
ncbi:MAG: PorV/PorQ family protein [Chitinispirillaceae bacterium]